MSKLDDRLLPVFARQHWLASAADVTREGGLASAASRRVASGRWELADVGVYRLVGPTPTWHADLLAPLLSIGSPAVASHFAAAALHQVPRIVRGVPEISVPRGRGTRRPGLRVHTSTDLDRAEPVEVDGIPVTGLHRTLLDMGRFVGDQLLLRSIEWARREHDVTWAEMIETLARHARRGRPGIRRLRRVIAANMDRSEVTDSDFELLVLALFAEVGLPVPVLHHRVFDGDRFVAEVDLAYPALRIAVELDGAVHLQREVRERDLPRQNDLILAGWTVLRFTWTRFVERPDQIISEVRAALRSASDHAA